MNLNCTPLGLRSVTSDSTWLSGSAVGVRNYGGSSSPHSIRQVNLDEMTRRRPYTRRPVRAWFQAVARLSSQVCKGHPWHLEARHFHKQTAST